MELYTNRLLDKEQTDAIQYDGSVVLGALPGSGKTTTVIERINRNISLNKKTLAFTFTKAAANEIKNRLSNNNLVTVSTMHSYCYSKLLENILSFRKKVILSQYMLDKIINQVQNKIDIYLEKNNICPDNIYNVKARIPFITEQYLLPANEIDSLMLKEYKILKDKVNGIDFSDIFYEYLNNKHICAEKFDEIIVDEFQDINGIQIEIIKSILTNNFNKDSATFYFVGDYSQCIYAFRYSNPDIMKDMLERPANKQTFYNIKYIPMWLRNNYRSNKYIIDFANKISPSKKYMRCTKQQLGRLTIMNTPDVVRVIESIDIENKTAAVLTRTNMELAMLQKKIILNSKKNIKYIVYNSFNLLDSSEAKDILAICNLMTNNKNYYAWNRISFLVPKLGIKTIDKAHNNNSLTDNMKIFISKLNPSNIKTTLSNVGYYDYLLKKSKQDIDEYNRRLDILEYFCGLYTIYNNPLDFINFINLSNTTEPINTKNEQDNNNNSNSKQEPIHLMTIHSSKGREYDTVFIPNCSDDTMPHYNAHKNNTLDEEQRLAWVAFTRAKENLIIGYNNNNKSRYIK